MNATIARHSSVLLFAGAFAAGAHAEYLCDPAPTPIDQRACAAAKQGPDALRRFVELWTSKMSNLYFPNYVDEKTAQSWDAKHARAKPTTEDGVKVASSEKR